MRRLLRACRSSRLVSKLTMRVLAIEAASFAAVIVISALALWPQMNGNAIDMARGLCDQMRKEIESSIADLQSASHYVISSRDLRVAINGYYASPSAKNEELLRLSLTHFRASQPGIRGLSLEGPGGARFATVAGLTQNDLSMLGQVWHQLASGHDYGSGFSDIYEERSGPGGSVGPGGSSGTGARSFAYSKSYFVDTEKFVLTVFYDAGDMLGKMGAIAGRMFRAYGLADRDGGLFLSEGASGFIDGEALRRMLSSGSDMASTAGGVYFVAPIPDSMWYLVAYADHWSLNQAFLSIFIITAALFALLCALTFLFAAPSMHRALSPLNELATTMGKVSGGKLDTVSQIETGDEIEDLSVIFNGMIRNLNDHIRKQIAHEQREHRMEYSLLVSQIDPHFICNTLNTLNFLAREGRSGEIVKVNTALIGILQDRLRVDSVSVFDTVAQEVETVKDYLLIQSCRYENNARVDWAVDDEAWGLPIPKNIIQPLVENALFHGLMDAETGEIRGEISVEIRKEGHGILIRVRDDGRGIEPWRLEQLNELNEPNEPNKGARRERRGEGRGKQIGIRNIQRRLAYLFRGADCMRIESGDGTAVSIQIPLIKEDAPWNPCDE